MTLREVRDFKGQELVDGVLALVDRHRPAPSVDRRRRTAGPLRELNTLLPLLSQARDSRPDRHERRARHAARVARLAPLPADRLHRRPPARARRTADAGHLRTHPEEHRRPPDYGSLHDHAPAGEPAGIHRGVPRLLVRRGPKCRRSGTASTRRRSAKCPTRFSGRTIASASSTICRRMRPRYPKLEVPKELLAVYAEPPQSPDECVFARLTTTISADLTTKISPCQFGGTPDCSNCGCMASAGMAAIARHRVFGVIPVGAAAERLDQESASRCGGSRPPGLSCLRAEAARRAIISRSWPFSPPRAASSDRRGNSSAG